MTRVNPHKMQYGGFKMIWYYCTKCGRHHRKSSKIGQRHRQFERKEEN